MQAKGIQSKSRLDYTLGSVSLIFVLAAIYGAIKVAAPNYYEIATVWSQLSGVAIFFSVLPALPGLFLLFPRQPRGRKLLLAVMALAGAIASFLAVAALGLLHLDCGNSCGSGTPTYTQNYLLALAMLLVWTIIPLISLFTTRRDK